MFRRPPEPPRTDHLFPSTPLFRSAASGHVGQAPAGQAGVASAPEDRLRLSAAASADAQSDARTSSAHAMQDAQQRVDTLQGNVDALNRDRKSTRLNSSH